VPLVEFVVSVTVTTAVHAVPGAALGGYWCVVEMSYGFVKAKLTSALPSPKCQFTMNESEEPTALGTVAPSVIVTSVAGLIGYVVCAIVGVAGTHGTVNTFTDAKARCGTRRNAAKTAKPGKLHRFSFALILFPSGARTSCVCEHVFGWLPAFFFAALCHGA